MGSGGSIVRPGKGCQGKPPGHRPPTADPPTTRASSPGHHDASVWAPRHRRTARPVRTVAERRRAG
ncbi:MAG: hypothetical protein OZSIB_2788 [Candidatus Ozemobacter sibiricus]|uniref:Uncharacterized protein n=1 Tax=Candidatus Ozemobacter sibiricus TaxID=2268124 RepID=A0A367ZS87_9BACT|nr:MAG: hypothetical protein OZSIB_2788 [Candidatus Ozemobacter sibiricus]